MNGAIQFLFLSLYCIIFRETNRLFQTILRASIRISISRAEGNEISDEKFNPKFDTSGVVIPATVEEGRTVTREFLFRVNTWTCTREDGVADNIVSPFVGPFVGIIYGAFRIMPPLYHHRGQVAAVYNLTKRYTQKRVRFLGESISSIGTLPTPSLPKLNL